MHPYNKTHTIASKIVKEIVLPELQREVNEDKNFAALRQVYSGMLLATWFKRELKESLLGQIYANKAKVKGVDQDPKTNEAIYRQYLKAYKKGVFNFIKEDVDKYTNETIPRKYFSGGTGDFAMAERFFPHVFKVTKDNGLGDQAMSGDEERDVVATVVFNKAVGTANAAISTEEYKRLILNGRVLEDWLIPNAPKCLAYVALFPAYDHDNGRSEQMADFTNKTGLATERFGTEKGVTYYAVNIGIVRRKNRDDHIAGKMNLLSKILNEEKNLAIESGKEKMEDRAMIIQSSLGVFSRRNFLKGNILLTALIASRQQVKAAPVEFPTQKYTFNELADFQSFQEGAIYRLKGHPITILCINVDDILPTTPRLMLYHDINDPQPRTRTYNEAIAHIKDLLGSNARVGGVSYSLDQMAKFYTHLKDLERTGGDRYAATGPEEQLLNYLLDEHLLAPSVDGQGYTSPEGKGSIILAPAKTSVIQHEFNHPVFKLFPEYQSKVEAYLSAGLDSNVRNKIQDSLSFYSQSDRSEEFTAYFRDPEHNLRPDMRQKLQGVDIQTIKNRLRSIEAPYYQRLFADISDRAMTVRQKAIGFSVAVVLAAFGGGIKLYRQVSAVGNMSVSAKSNSATAGADQTMPQLQIVPVPFLGEAEPFQQTQPRLVIA